MTTPESTPQPVTGELSHCACGAESPASTDPTELDAWEDDHTHRDCPHMDTWWDEYTRVDEDTTYRFPPLPAMTRYPAEVLSPRVEPTVYRRRRLRSDIANDMFGRTA